LIEARNAVADIAPHIITVAHTGSTNADMVAKSRQGAGEGTWLRAEQQSAGRGRMGRNWHSALGNFYGSTLVRLRDEDPAAATLAMLTAVCVFDVVQPLLHTPAALQIKWPNDVLFSGAKLSGILLERSDDAVIIGIGVNVVSAPKVDGRNTCCIAEHGMVPDIDAFTQALAKDFATKISNWRCDSAQIWLKTSYLARAHPVGAHLKISLSAESQVQGVFDGLADDGALRLRLADGSTMIVHAGDVDLI
jgi:BirA family transcriptional regulator, biotin operon repressor / biotin---[acetyl-CoA-carboxylase] ligase